jgi:hypothetical protein
MANIKILELAPAGFELLQDSESFLDELNNRETSTVFGGLGEDNYLAALLGADGVDSIKIDTVNNANSNVRTVYTASVVTFIR